MRRSSTALRLKEHGSSILVAGLSSAFGVALLQVTGALTSVIMGDDVGGSSVTAGIMLGIVAVVFIVIAVYVGAIVTANTFATIVAGRARTIALLRLIGSSARTQRRAVAREGLVVGLIGSLAGAVVGTALAVGIARLGVATGTIPEFTYGWIDPVLIVPVVAVVLTTWLASWIGSRRVLTVTPLEAIGGSQERSRDELLGRRGRHGAAITLIVIGAILLVFGMLVGLLNPLGVLIGVVGGVLSFTGLVFAAQLIMPPALRLVGRMLGRSPSARLAAENPLRYPERSSRTTIGVVIGVTLITMFGVATASFKQMVLLASEDRDAAMQQGVEQLLDAVTGVFSALIGVSALIAAVGLVNSLSLSVLQRTRELGLLRALGFSTGQLRRMVLAESVQLTATSVLVGLVLGGVYGWIGAQSLLGSMVGPGIVAPGIPWALLAIVVGAAALLTAVATVAPARRATRVSPVTALAVE